MSYVDGFVIAVPKANKNQFIEHANKGDSVFAELGATRILECWGDDVPNGKVTDYRRAVQAKDGEEVVYSYIQWPDKATRDAGWARMMAEHPEQSTPMPFDGKRMFWGGFRPILDTAAE